MNVKNIKSLFACNVSLELNLEDGILRNLDKIKKIKTTGNATLFK